MSWPNRNRSTSLIESETLPEPTMLNICVAVRISSARPPNQMHFQTWQDKAGNAPPLTDPTTGLTFPDLNADSELTQTNLIMPEPTIFLDRKFPIVSIIRPTQTKGAAMGTVRALTADGLSIGQSPEFFAVLAELATAADAARHGS